jgi:hypothetical protein
LLILIKHAVATRVFDCPDIAGCALRAGHPALIGGFTVGIIGAGINGGAVGDQIMGISEAAVILERSIEDRTEGSRVSAVRGSGDIDGSGGEAIEGLGRGNTGMAENVVIISRNGTIL